FVHRVDTRGQRVLVFGFPGGLSDFRRAWKIDLETVLGADVLLPVLRGGGAGEHERGGENDDGRAHVVLHKRTRTISGPEGPRLRQSSCGDDVNGPMAATSKARWRQFDRDDVNGQ